MTPHARSKANASKCSASTLLQEAYARKTEQSIVNLFRVGALHPSIPVADEIPLNQMVDTIVYEFQFRFGRADIVVFHVDGTATVIEVKNGSNGYNHVVAGIGQASLYAVQLATSGAAPKKVRKALLWTSTGDIAVDLQIMAACNEANTIPMSWGEIGTLLKASKQAVDKVLAECGEA